MNSSDNDNDSDVNGGGVDSGNLAKVIPMWKGKLEVRSNKSGQPEYCPSLLNASLFLTHEQQYVGCIALDKFSGVTRIVKTLPRIEGLKAPTPGPLNKNHVSHLIMALAAIQGMNVSRDIAEAAIDVAASYLSYNPLTDMLDELRWDGVKRIDTWLTEYIGVEDCEYTRNVGRWWLISAVARAYEPGCQADHMLVFEGKQDAGKSSAFRILGGNFTLPKLPNVRNYDRAAHALAGKWIVEIGELDAFRGSGATEIKDFLSLREDHYHAPYGHHHITRGRTVVFGGTTNDDHYLHDATGARRFWPVKVGRIDCDALRRDRDLLFAESVAAYHGGLPGGQWWPPEDTKPTLHLEQEDRQEIDAWEPLFKEWLESNNGVTTGDVLQGAVKLMPCDWSKDSQKRAGHILRRFKWFVSQRREDGVKTRRYYRPGTAVEEIERIVAELQSDAKAKTAPAPDTDGGWRPW